MTLDVHNTTSWSEGQLLRYGAEITRAMHKLADRFPKDLTVASLFDEIASGRRQLWLILDGPRFVSFVLTELKLVEPTGHRICMITDLAGEDGEASVPLIGKIEAWAREQGADEMAIMGRLGWKRSLAKQGYRADVMVYRKMLESLT